MLIQQKRNGSTPFNMRYVLISLVMGVIQALNRHKLREEEDRQRASGPERRDHDRWI